MGYLENNKIKEYVIDQLIDKLYDYEDVESYGCDLAYTLYEGENADGSITYSTYEAKQWISKYFDDLDEIVEELNFQFGKDFMANYNPFENPERFMVVIVIEVASYLLGQCKTIEKNWNNEFKLIKSKINKIKKELEELR